MTRDHTAIEELLAARSLGGLDTDDLTTLEAELASHGECAECRRIQSGFDEVAGRLAFALDPVPLTSLTADEVLARVGGRGTPDGRQARPRRNDPWRAVAAVAAAIVLVVVTATVLRTRSAEVTLAAGQTFTTFEGPEGGGTLTLAYTPGRTGAFFWGSGLPDPGTGKVYEIWTIRGETPISGGCVRPATGGRLALFVDTDLDEADLMAVTVEDEACPEAPTTGPLYLAEIV